MAAATPEQRGEQSLLLHTGYIGFVWSGQPKHSSPHFSSCFLRLLTLPFVRSRHFSRIVCALSCRNLDSTLFFCAEERGGQSRPVRLTIFSIK